jgi:hypothetical protein
MKKLVSWLVGLLVVSLVSYGYAVDTEDVTLTVTPLYTEAITVTPGSYAYGSLNLSISSVSASALEIANTGTVGVSLERTVTNDGADWTIATSTGNTSEFVLWAMTNATRPNAASDFTTGNGHRFSATTGDPGYGNLTNSGGTQQTLGISGTANLWFRLDMPTSVSNSNQQTITVRIRATAL